MNEHLFQGNVVTSNRILYTPSSFAKTSLIHLQEVGMLIAKNPHVSRRKNLTSYLFFIVKHGFGILEYMGKIYELQAGDCVFIDCRKSYAQHTSKLYLWELSWVHFYGPNMSNIYDKYIERGGRPVFHSDNVDSILGLLYELYTLANSTDYVKDMIINEKLSILLTYIMKESWHPESSKINSHKKYDLQTIKEYLDENYKEKINLEDLAEKFYINKFYLTRIFKEQYGCSISNYLQQKRITKAKQLLRFTDDSIETICMKCGIDDANYFGRLFKKVEGVTPGSFRKMW